MGDLEHLRLTEPPSADIYIGKIQHCDRLEVNEPVLHLFRLHHLPNLGQALDHAAETTLALTAINDTGVRNARGIDPQEVFVQREDDPPLGEGVLGVPIVTEKKTTIFTGTFVQIASRS